MSGRTVEEAQAFIRDYDDAMNAAVNAGTNAALRRLGAAHQALIDAITEEPS